MAQTGSEIAGSQENMREEQDLGYLCEKKDMKEKKRKHDNGAAGDEEGPTVADGGKKRCKVGLAQAWLLGSGCSGCSKYLKPSYWVSRVEVRLFYT